jgi:hypothetical protein
MALILHPARRTKWLLSQWPKDRADKAIHFCQWLWEKHRDSLLASSSFSYEAQHIGQLGKKSQAPKELNVFERIKEQRAQQLRPQSQDEYDDYCQEPSYDPGINPLQWWLQDAQRKRFPRLSALALNILSIPAMSAEPERVFSGGRRTISWDRAKLSVSTLEILECQKNWRKQTFPRDILN